MSDYFISGQEIKEKIHTISIEKYNRICFIFGAGASHGYTDKVSLRAPIMKDIINPENKLVSGTINLPEHEFIQDKQEKILSQLSYFNDDLESYLSDLYKRDKDDHLFPKFLLYLQDLFNTVSENFEDKNNYYKKLIDIIYDLRRNKPWSCLSFNYDTLFEQSYIKVDRDPIYRDFSTIDGYLNFNPMVLKMHGGVNFWYYKTQLFEWGDDRWGISKNKVCNIFSELMSSNQPANSLNIFRDIKRGVLFEKRTIFNKEENKYYDKSFFYFPLMLIPIHEDVGVENSFFKKMLDLGTGEINKSNLIIAIGYNFHDESFNNEIKKLDLSNKEIVLVDTESTIMNIDKYKAFQNLNKFWRKDNLKIFKGNGFGEFVNNLI